LAVTVDVDTLEVEKNLCQTKIYVVEHSLLTIPSTLLRLHKTLTQILGLFCVQQYF